MKTHAVEGGAPTDERRPECLTVPELRQAREERDAAKRLQLHRHLLAVTLLRLRSGRRLEVSHGGIVHPEVSTITRDAVRLIALVYGSSVEAAELVEEVEAPPVELSDAAKALSSLVARSSALRVAKLVGRTPREVSSWASGAAVPDAATQALLEARLRVPSSSWGTT
jgi:hypothetical protein